MRPVRDLKRIPGIVARTLAARIPALEAARALLITRLGRSGAPLRDGSPKADEAVKPEATPRPDATPQFGAAPAVCRGGVFRLGFHGDRYLLELVELLAARARAFVETGANLGTTTRYMANRHPELPVYSCEPDADAWQACRETLAPYPNAHVSRLDAVTFLHRLHEDHPSLRSSSNLYWLDAHGFGFRWPLTEEVAFLTTTLQRSFLLIDDFRVPGRPDFLFEQYDDQVCSVETIAPAIAPGATVRLFYPRYRERTSFHHPLVGTGLLVLGDPDFQLPHTLQESFGEAPLPLQGPTVVAERAGESTQSPL